MKDITDPALPCTRLAPRSGAEPEKATVRGRSGPALSHTSCVAHSADPGSRRGPWCRARERVTGYCTSRPPCSCATPPRAGPTSTARRPAVRPRWKPCAASRDACPTFVYRHLVDDAITAMMTGRGGQRGNDSCSSATGSRPHTGSSDKPLPGPAKTKPTTPSQPRLDTERSQIR
jgi:hypothetical protein